MKKSAQILILIVLVGLLGACTPAATTTPQPNESIEQQIAVTATASDPVDPSAQTGYTLDSTYPDAASIRNQLAYGILVLDDTANEVTPEQSQALLPLWQAVLLLTNDSLTASEELTAVQDQIIGTLTQSQLQEIVGMKITNAVLSEYYASLGIIVPTPAPGVTPGAKKNMSEQDKLATRTANESAGLSSGNGQAARTVLIERVVDYLISNQ